MTEYKSFIDSIYLTITDKNKSDKDKSNIVIDSIQSIMTKSTSKSKSSSQSKKTDDSKMSCSGFTNIVVQFVCKLDKNKEKLCNIPGPVAWALGKDKINTIISFITTNGAFVDAVWQRFQTDNDKNEITRLIDSLANKSSATCVQPFLQQLINKSKLSVTPLESRPSSTSSVLTVGSSLTSGESRPSSTSSLTSVGSSVLTDDSRPSSTSSLTSVGTDINDSEYSISSSKSSSKSLSGDNKRYGKRFPSPPILSPSTFEREPLTEEQKDYTNMWKDESQAYNPNNMWLDKTDWKGGKTRRKRKTKRNRKTNRKEKRRITRNYKK